MYESAGGSKVSSGIDRLPVLASLHRSGIVNGLTHFIALAGDTWAVAVAMMSTCDTPKSDPISVGIALPLSAVRKTSTFTRFGWPFGSSGNVTSAGVTDTIPEITAFDCDVLI